MKRNYGFTVMEMMIAIVVLMIVSAGVALLNNRGATEDRAYENAQIFVAKNGIEVKRMNCAGDSNGDGYGTCTVVAKDGEKIMLQCPTGFGDTKIYGATGCKEIFQNLNMQGNIPLD